MSNPSLTGLQVRSDLRNFLEEALQAITGEQIVVTDLSRDSCLLSAVSQKIARENDLDSAVVAAWIKRSVFDYWQMKHQATT